MKSIKQCPCSVYDVYGYGSAELYNTEPDDFGPRLASWFLTKVPSVWNRYVATQTSVRIGEFPKDHNERWEVDMPVGDITSTFHGSVIDVNGFRIFYSGDTPLLMAMFNYTSDYAGADYESESNLEVFVTVDPMASASEAVLSTSIIPDAAKVLMYESLSIYELSPMVGGDSVVFGVDEFYPACVGVSYNTIMMMDSFANTDDPGVFYMCRYDLNTNECSWGYSLLGQGTDIDLYIRLPAQMTSDGNPWVVAMNYDLGQMWTGICPVFPSVSGDPAPVGALGVADRINQLDDKSGFAGVGTIPWAYTRRNGYDYVLAKNGGNFKYYDGSNSVWNTCTSSIEYSNIHACEDGEIVLAGGRTVTFIDPNDSSNNWEWSPQDFDGRSDVSISSNSVWIQVKGMQINAMGTPDVFDIATADIASQGNNLWIGSVASNYEQECRQWSFSKESDGAGNPKVVVPHRTTAWLDPIPGDGPYDVLELANNRYVCFLPPNTGFIRGVLRGAVAEPFSDRDAGHRNFDAVIGCRCGCLPDPRIPY